MESPDAGRLYRKLPSVDELLLRPEVAALCARYSRELVTEAARSAVAELRASVRAGAIREESLDRAVEELGSAIEGELRMRVRPSLRPVINATGVILQTNLGRAPLSEAAVARVAEVARGYCNVEFDLRTGERSRRDVHAERLVLQVLGLRAGLGVDALLETHGAAVVNNCAAATFLALNTMAEGGEVVVSRGELVEIGGGFRVPEILGKSGAVLREVGTTNKTRVGDYAAAVGPATRLILRVHRSNFRIEGFTEQPTLAELVELGRRTGVPVFEDQGTGCVVDLEAFGLPGESQWVRSVTGGVALVASSGDKLLGGPQCGLLVGERAWIDRVRANPLFRALRVDKLTYAALEATLGAYLAGDEASVPVIAMLQMPAEAIRERCAQWVAALAGSALEAEVVPVRSVVGGGTTPGASLPSFAVALRHAGMSEGAVAARLRAMEPAVVTRTSEGRVLLDLRTVPAAEDAGLIERLRSALAGRAGDAGDEG